MSAWALIGAVVLLVANGLFVAKEFSLIASSAARLETRGEDGGLADRYALEATGELPIQLASSQLGVTMASLLLGAIAEPAAADAIRSLLSVFGAVPTGVAEVLGLIVGLGIVVFLHMVIGEMVPKYVALADPERVLRALAIPNRGYVALFRPVIRVLNGMANIGTRWLGVEPRDELATAHTAQELASIVSRPRQAGLIEDLAHELLTGALDFGERPVEQVTVPRDEVTWVRRRTTVAEAEAAVVASGHSRVVVADHGLDDAIGFVHVKDLLTVAPDAHERPLPFSRIRRLLVVQVDERLDDVLVSMRRTRTHLALVVDASRAVVGVATLEDVLEALVGDIRDESDIAERARRRRLS